MMDFIDDPATHSAGVLAKFGKDKLGGMPDFDRLCTAVQDWLTDAGVDISDEVLRGMLTALALLHTRMDLYLEDPEREHPIMDMVIAEVAATLVELHDHPRSALDLDALDFQFDPTSASEDALEFWQRLDGAITKEESGEDPTDV